MRCPSQTLYSDLAVTWLLIEQKLGVQLARWASSSAATCWWVGLAWTTILSTLLPSPLASVQGEQHIKGTHSPELLQDFKRHAPVLYYAGGDQKSVYMQRVSGEPNWILLETTNALITENYVIFTFFFFPLQN